MITESISDLLELTAKLMELHSENPFKIKAISSAAYRISKMNMDLSGKTLEELECMEGIGKGRRLFQRTRSESPTGFFPPDQRQHRLYHPPG